jgi:mono/diheme cytochrome c family protein
MSQHNPDIQPPPVPHPNEAIQPYAADFVETPDVPPLSGVKESFPVWLYLICGFALFMAGSSFTGFGIFGMGLMDQGPGGPSLASASNTQSAQPADPLALGKKDYNNNCASGHQASGEGSPGKYPPLVNSPYVVGSKDRLSAILLAGLSGPLTVNGGSYGAMVMQSWSSNFSDSRLANIMTYLRASWGNTANAVTTDEVTKARAKFASHTSPFSEAELMKIAPDGPDPSDKK